MTRMIRRGFSSPRAISILPVGPVTPAKGECEYFNIYETWADSTVEVWTLEGQRKFKFVCTAGTSDRGWGEVATFRHDQTRRELGTWIFLEAMTMEVFRGCNYPRSSMFTYK